jgi:hypothetical protein
MYLESVAMVPQLYMFQKQAGDEGGVVEVREGREGGRLRAVTFLDFMICALVTPVTSRPFFLFV